MCIEDDELRTLFQDESDEQLACLERGLLDLATDLTERQCLDDVYRAAHSLKGAARMLQLSKVEAIAHRFESLLSDIRRGTRPMEAAALMRLHQAIDPLRQFCSQAVTGSAVNVELSAVLERLETESEADAVSKLPNEVQAVRDETAQVVTDAEVGSSDNQPLEDPASKSPRTPMPDAAGPRIHETRVELASSQGKRVLLVEDSRLAREEQRRILEAAGFEVLVAKDGQDAWHELSEGSFDAVVSDIEMPRLDGLALTMRIRESIRLRHLPVILVTSLSGEEDRKRGMAVGADAYLSKAEFNESLFIQTLRKLT